MGTSCACNASDHSDALVNPSKRAPRRFNRNPRREGYERDRSYVGTTDREIAIVEAARIDAIKRHPSYCEGDECSDTCASVSDDCRHTTRAEVCAEEVRRHGVCRHCEESC